MIDLGKTKAMIFHTPKLTCKQVTITLFRGQVKYWIYVYVCMHACMYMGVRVCSV